MENIKHKHKDVVINKIGGELVVTSRQVAEDFEKNHADVVTKIEGKVRPNGKSEIGLIQGIIDSGEIPKNYFIEDSYLDSYGRKQKEYLLTKDGFSLLVMGFTGAKALQWKLKYIEAFNKMEEHIKGQAFNTSRLSKELQAILMLDEKTVEMDNRITSLEERMTIETGAQKILCDLVNNRVKVVLGGKDTPAYKELAKKTYSQCWRNFKNVLQVASYKDTPVKDFDLAKKVIIDWQPNRELELMIRGCNAQMRM